MGDYIINSYGEITHKGGGRRSSLELSKNSLLFTANKGSDLITVKPKEGWQFSVYPSSWVHVSNCSNSIIVTVDQNYQNNNRQTYFVVKYGDHEKRVYVYQTGNKIAAPKNTSSDNEGCGCWGYIVFSIGCYFIGKILGQLFG